MWQRLRTINAFRGKYTAAVGADSSVADKLNSFYVCASTSLPTSTTERSSSVSFESMITISEDEVGRALKHVNIGKVAGPDGIFGCVLRSCANLLACLFTSIFNEYLAKSCPPPAL